MKNTTTNKILVVSGIVAVVATAAYFANNKSKVFAIAGAGLGFIVAALALPKIITTKVV